MESEPTPTAELPLYDEAWAREQLSPLWEAAVQAIRDGRWNDLYDLYAEPVCSRSEFVSEMLGAALLAEAFGGLDELVEALRRDIEEGRFVGEFVAATETRITWIDDDGAEQAAIRVDNEWRFEGDPCEGFGDADACNAVVEEWNQLVDEWNSLSQEERDSFITGDEITGFDNWMAQRGYPSTLEEIYAERGLDC